MPVPNCMRVELERRTPRAGTLKNLYKYYYRKIPKPGVRRRYTESMYPWLSDYRMRMLKREIKEVWEDEDGKEDEENDEDDEDEEDLDDGAQKD